MTIDELIKQAEQQDGLNIPLFNKAAEQLRLADIRFDQDAVGIEERTCGTVACLGGHLLLAADCNLTKADEIARRLETSTLSVATMLAGLPDGHELFCFDGLGWPEEYRHRLEMAQSPRDEAEVAASLLDAIASGAVTL